MMLPEGVAFLPMPNRANTTSNDDCNAAIKFILVSGKRPSRLCRSKNSKVSHSHSSLNDEWLWDTFEFFERQRREGRLPLTRMNFIAALQSSFDVVFALFGIGRNATPSGSIINKLRTDRFQAMTILNKLSGKALTVEDSSTNQGARIEQITRSDAPNQRWSIKYVK